MADRELRRLKRRDLLKMLLVQCEETERIQQEYDELKSRFDVMEESYERLKEKLNVKDERLNQKDAKIVELKNTITEMKESRKIELEEAGSIAMASLKLNGVFEAAQKAADQYLLNIQRLSEEAARKDDEVEPKSPKSLMLMPMPELGGKHYKSGWSQLVRRKANG